MGRLITIGRCGILLGFLISLAACDGGGGGNGGNGGNDLGSAPGMSVNPSALSFTADQVGPIPLLQTVSVFISASDAAFVIAGYPAGTTPPQWLSLSVNGQSNSALVHVAVNTTSLTPSVYTATARIGILRSNQSLIAYRDVAVTYLLKGKILVSPSTLSYTQLIGEPAVAAQSLSIQDTGSKSYAWGISVVQPDATWLSASPSSGASLPATSSITVNPALSPGTYNATLRVSGNGNLFDVPVSYMVRAPRINAAPTQVGFTAERAQTTLPKPVDISLTSENGKAIGYTVNVTYGAGVSEWLTVSGSGTSPGILTLTPNITDLIAGTYTANVIVTPSNGATPLSIPVTYIVTSSAVSTSATQVAFNAINGQAFLPGATTLSVTAANGKAIPYSVSVQYLTTETGWLTAPSSGTTPAALVLAPNSVTLSPSIHTAKVVLTPANGAADVVINVSYTVTASSLTLTPGQESFVLTITSLPTDANLKRTVQTGQTGAALTWTASSSVPWLTVTASGASGGAATLSLDLAALDSVDNGQQTATVTFTYSGPFVTNQVKTLSAILNMNVAKVNYVAPYVALSNTSASVIIRGSGFNIITNQGLRFGSNATSPFSVVSDTEIRATHPTFTTAGSYGVRIENRLGINRSRANLVVVGPQTYSYAAVTPPTSALSAGSATTSASNRIIYDAERKALYVAYWGDGKIGRFRFGATGWVADSLSIPGLRDISFTPDGKELIAVSTTILYHVDPVLFTVIRQATTTELGILFGEFTRIAMANDGNALLCVGGFCSFYKYNVLAHTATHLLGPSTFSGAMAASGDGSRIVIGQSGISPVQPVSYYDSSAGTISSTSLAANAACISVDRTASRAALQDTIVNGQFVNQGSVPGTCPTVSPDGSRAYIHSVVSPAHLIRAFDLLSPGGFTEIGTGITILDVPTIFAPVLTITPDGGTVFLSGDQKLIVQPVP